MSEPVCYGLMCPHRARCERYAVLGEDGGPAIESCQQGDRWPLFQPQQGEARDDDAPAG